MSNKSGIEHPPLKAMLLLNKNVYKMSSLNLLSQWNMYYQLHDVVLFNLKKAYYETFTFHIIMQKNKHINCSVSTDLD